MGPSLLTGVASEITLTAIQTLLSSTAPSAIVGTVAAAVADDGSAPIKEGGVVSQQSPTFQEGQRASAHYDSRGHKGGVIFGPNSNSGAAVGLSGRATSASSNRLATRGAAERWNGTSYDHEVKPNGASRLASSAATTNAMLAKAGSCDAVRATGRSQRTTVCWLKLYDMARPPVVGTDTPARVFGLEPLAPFNIALDFSYFPNGLAYALTSGVADSDTGPIAAGDITGFNLIFAA